jgi:hypothetical protein
MTFKIGDLLLNKKDKASFDKNKNNFADSINKPYFLLILTEPSSIYEMLAYNKTKTYKNQISKYGEDYYAMNDWLGLWALDSEIGKTVIFSIDILNQNYFKINGFD